MRLAGSFFKNIWIKFFAASLPRLRHEGREVKREEGRGKREEGRGKREEGRGKREEGRGKREEGRGKGRGKREKGRGKKGLKERIVGDFFVSPESLDRSRLRK